jgi:hypothetical protein
MEAAMSGDDQGDDAFPDHEKRSAEVIRVLYGDREDWTVPAEVVRTLREMPTAGEVMHGELGAPRDLEAADIMGRFLTAVWTGDADEWLFTNAMIHNATTVAEHDAFLGRLQGVRRELDGIMLAVLGCDERAMRMQLAAAKAYARLGVPIDQIGRRRAQLVEMTSTPVDCEYDTEAWRSVWRSLCALDEKLQAIDVRKIYDAYIRATRSGNEVTWMAARISLDLDMFGDRTRLLSERTDAAAYSTALKIAVKPFAKAHKHYSPK